MIPGAMRPTDEEQAYANSLADNQRQFEEEQRRAQEELERTNEETRNRRYAQAQYNMPTQMAGAESSGAAGELAAAGIGGAGSVTGGSALTGEAGGAAAASYGGGQASSVLPGIFGGSTAGSGAAAGAEGIFGGSAAGAGASGGMAAGGGAAGGGAAAGGGSLAGGGGIAAAGPWAALAAAIVGHNQWAEKKGLRENEDYKLQTGIEGRALYKDSAWYQPRLNNKVDGLGDEVRLVGLGSSPTELFKGKNWAEAAKIAATGGILGKALKKLF